MAFKPRLSKKVKYQNGQVEAHKLKKFMVTESSTSFVYRSSYEYLFMLWCEQNEFVVKWYSEPFSIKYFDISSERVRNYWIDFIFIDINDVKYFCEIKPSNDIEKVKKFKHQLSTISNPEAKRKFARIHEREAKNLSKWTAAKEYCNKHELKFVLVDEKFLKSKIV